MRTFFWTIAIVVFIGLFGTTADARGYHGRHRGYYHHGYHHGYHGRYYGHRGYYGHRHYHHGYYAPRPVVRVSVPVPRPPRVIVRP